MVLGERGQRLYDAYCGRVDDGGLVLLEEACRIADRLDRLDSLLTGEADVWCRLVHNVRTEDYELRIDDALSEARQQANALRQLVSSLAVKREPDGGDDGWLDEGLAALLDAEG